MPAQETPPKPPQPPAWALVGELGFAFCTPVVLAAVAGAYFDASAPLMIVLILGGVALGGLAAYWRVAPYLK